MSTDLKSCQPGTFSPLSSPCSWRLGGDFRLVFCEKSWDFQRLHYDHELLSFFVLKGGLIAPVDYWVGNCCFGEFIPLMRNQEETCTRQFTSFCCSSLVGFPA